MCGVDEHYVARPLDNPRGASGLILQLGTAGYDIEVNHNVMVQVASGPSWHGSGSPPAGKVGTKYFHHNVIDASVPMLYGRIDPHQKNPAKFGGPHGDGIAAGRPFGAHSFSGVTGADPWKVYHNTILGHIDVDNRGFGVDYVYPFF